MSSYQLSLFTKKRKRDLNYGYFPALMDRSAGHSFWVQNDIFLSGHQDEMFALNVPANQKFIRCWQLYKNIVYQLFLRRPKPAILHRKSDYLNALLWRPKQVFYGYCHCPVLLAVSEPLPAFLITTWWTWTSQQPEKFCCLWVHQSWTGIPENVFLSLIAWAGRGTRA